MHFQVQLPTLYMLFLNTFANVICFLSVFILHLFFKFACFGSNARYLHFQRNIKGEREKSFPPLFYLVVLPLALNINEKKNERECQKNWSYFMHACLDFSTYYPSVITSTWLIVYSPNLYGNFFFEEVQRFICCPLKKAITANMKAVRSSLPLGD